MRVVEINRKNIEVMVKEDKGSIAISWSGDSHIWGMGEHYDHVEFSGRCRCNKVVEKFTEQGDKTYLPIPFFINRDFGLLVDTKRVFSLLPSAHGVVIEGNLALEDKIVIFHGKPKSSISSFLTYMGGVSDIPLWVFGQWASANRWKSVDDIRELITSCDTNGIKISVVVVEAWSDETTFYRFNHVDPDYWKDIKELISYLGHREIKLLLWQCPVIKKLEHGQVDAYHNAEEIEVIEKNLVVKNSDGSPYIIPENHWFAGSMVPDFTNPDMLRWWFDRRKPLLDLNIAGFKTDGGEFILSDDVVFHDGARGIDMQNYYPMLYVRSYLDNIGTDKITFSRSGYLGSNLNSIHWAGDQKSTWTELRSVVKAGLSAALSGIFWWGFDIAGFAGPLPSAELYLRSYILSVFTPIMQWHSEPLGGQFKELIASNDALNDRSPWNIALRSGNKDVIGICRKYSNLRYDLMPYIKLEYENSRVHNEPMMRPLVYEYPDDVKTYLIEDEFFFGRSLLVAPILGEGERKRDVYIPEGEWFDVQTRTIIKGSCLVNREYSIDEIGLFIKKKTEGESILQSIL